MVFGFSFGEVALILGATVALVGPKELPVIARAAGRLTGKAVGYMQKARGQMDDILQRSEYDQVQKEIQEKMSQLDAILHEMRTGVSIIHQRPFTRESNATITSNQEEILGIKETQDHVNSTDIGLRHVFSNPNLQVPKTIGLDQSSVNLQCQATAYARLAAVTLNAEKVQSHTQIPSPGVNTHLGLQIQEEVLTHGGERFQVLPVSAAVAGLLPPRKGPQLGGSDLVLESLVERKVAHQALAFFQQPDLHM